MEEWAHAMISSHIDKNSASSCSGIFTLPSTWVITMKLPFKTLGSIKRNVQQIKERVGLIEPIQVQQQQQQQQPNPRTGSNIEEKSIMPPPSWLDQMARHLCKDSRASNSKDDDDDDETTKQNSSTRRVVHWNAQVVHLMANSDSERTLIATFFEMPEPV
jgi:hypothetical protein